MHMFLVVVTRNPKLRTIKILKKKTITMHDYEVVIFYVTSPAPLKRKTWSEILPPVKGSDAIIPAKATAPTA